MDFLTRVRRVTEHRLAAAQAPCLEHMREWQQVLDWLEDEASRKAYADELAFWVLRRLFGDDVAAHHASSLSPADWADAHKAVLVARERGLIPAMQTLFPETHPVLLYSQAANFILNQYEYHGITGIRQGDIVLDCGGYFGETALFARMQGAARVYVFEPNPDSFDCLQANAQRYDPQQSWFFPVPLAVGDTIGSVAFRMDAEHPACSALDDAGTTTVTMTTLDVWCTENKVAPDFIKMDLEGAEAQALLGAQQVFRTHRPRCAICLYHQLEHMWQLPRLLKLLVPEYRLWCKKSAPAAEFVLFGEVRPKESRAEAPCPNAG